MAFYIGNSWITGLFILLLFSVYSARSQHNTITVNPVNCSDLDCSNCSCTVCQLSIALFYLQECGNNTEINIVQGTYNLSNSSLIYFSWFNNIAIRGKGQVHLECDSGIGLTFVYCSNVTLQDITLLYCGKEQNSTSLRFNEASTISYIQFNVSLYILYCNSIQLIAVKIISSNGTGMQMYGTVGTNIFKNCNFVENKNSNGGPGGGGLYIEFPFCSPGDMHCDSWFTSVSEVWSSNASYLIQDCIFDSNFATTVSSQDSAFVPYVPGGRNNQAFARGGGLSLFFKGNATNNSIIVKRCTFINNVATWGAGLFVEFQDLSTKNTLSVENTYFISNICEANALFGSGTTGGGARIGFIFYYPNHASENTVLFESTIFSNNSAFWGGGVSFYTAKEKSIAPTNQVKFNNCSWIRNHGKIGSAVDLMMWHQSMEGVIMTLQFANCSFSDNGDLNITVLVAVSSSVGFGTFFTDSVPVNFSGQTRFVNNSESALIGIAAALSFVTNSSVTFSNNIGRYGGALQLLGYAFIQVYDYTVLTFEGNFASIQGGAIYSEGIGEQDSLTAATACFIRFYDFTKGPYNWTAQFNFKNNSIREGTNSIYATSIEGCKLGGAYGPSNQNLTIPFCWGAAWNYDGQDCARQIKSGVSSIKMTGNITPFSGEVIKLPIALLDDLNATITTPEVLGISTKSHNGMVRTTSRYSTDHSASFIGSVSAHAICRVETSNPTIFMDFEITLQNCPAGYVFEHDTCNCNEISYNGLVKCSAKGPTIQNGAWIGTLSNDSNENYYVGYSPYLSDQNFSLQYLNINISMFNMCMKNRGGVLCADCNSGYAPSFNDATFICVECNGSYYNWLMWLLIKYIPLTILFIIVVLFHVNVTSGPVNALVFFAQMFVITSHETPSTTASTVYLAVYNIANLDFSFGKLVPPICLSENFQGLKIISMKYLEALYPIILLLITYILVHLYDNGIQPVYFIFHCFHKCFVRIKRTINLRTSVIDGFATFLVLAYTKIAFVSLYVLVPTSLFSYNGTALEQKRLYYMGSTIYYSEEHIPHFIISVIILTIFIVLPPLILLVYPLRILRRFLECLRCNHCIGAKCSHLMDTFQGCYKNGTNGTCDCRYFAGLYLIYRVALMLCLLQPEYFLQFVIKQLVLMAMAVSFAVLRPYTNEMYNSLDTTILVTMVALNTLKLYIDNNNFLTAAETTGWVNVIKDCLIFFPLLYLAIFIIYSVWKSEYMSNSIFMRATRRLFCFSRVQSTQLVAEEDEFLNDLDRFADSSEHLLAQDRSRSEIQYGTM